MSKYLYVPCPICGKGVRAKNKQALVRLCKKHRTKEGIEKLQHMKIEEIIKIKDSFTKIKFKNKKIQIENKNANPTPKKLEPKVTIKDGLVINEFGEPL